MCLFCVFRGRIAKPIGADEGFSWAAVCETSVWKAWGIEHMSRRCFTQLHSESERAIVFPSTHNFSVTQCFVAYIQICHVFSQADVCALLKCAQKLLSAGLFSPHLLWQEYWTHQVCVCFCINSDMSYETEVVLCCVHSPYWRWCIIYTHTTSWRWSFCWRGTEHISTWSTAGLVNSTPG